LNPVCPVSKTFLPGQNFLFIKIQSDFIAPASADEMAAL
jgi:hypothetical protein